MGTSPLVHTERADAEPAGRDTRSLGPSDSSDSGSDLAGAESLDVNDPYAPVDAATGEDIERSPVASEELDEAGASDAAGTGERRAAAADAGHDAADIAPDRIIDIGATEGDDGEAALIDPLAVAPTPDDEEEDEDAAKAEPFDGSTAERPQEHPATGIASHGSTTSRKI